MPFVALLRSTLLGLGLSLLLLASACQPPASHAIDPVNISVPTLTSSPPPPRPHPSFTATKPLPAPEGSAAGAVWRSLIPSATPLPSPTATREPRTVLLFTGVIVPARCVQAAIDARGDPDYLYDEVRPMIQQADLAIGTLNATISDHPPHTGCLPTYVLVGGSDNADALARAGFDAISVATNHIKNCGLANCGNRAFFDTLANLRRVGILPVGAGRNHGEAMRPIVVEANGIRFGIVSLGQIESMAFAGEKTPGIAVLDEQNLRDGITAARRVSDVVIAMPHWGPEDQAVPNASQQSLARVAVEAGADLVVGNHTHVVQGRQEFDGVPVFYGLGNFVFDQNWSRETQQGVILKVVFEGEKLVDTELIPTHVDFDGTVHLAGPEEAAEILARIEQASQAIPQGPRP